MTLAGFFHPPGSHIAGWRMPDAASDSDMNPQLYYEIQRYGTVAPYVTVISHVYVNPRWWNGLRPEQREAIGTAARKAEQDQIGVTEETAEAAVGELRAKGMTIHEQTPDQSATWRGAMQQPVVDAFLRMAPEGGNRILELLRAIPAA